MGNELLEKNMTIERRKKKNNYIRDSKRSLFFGLLLNIWLHNFYT
jgi:hypothetical protein